ncbi:MAG TPA: hypothetical protein PLE92_13050, partial [Lentisphaeria bacterium]|nr:hypothetical protein [Lentisphaeria bacterium]
SRFLDFGEGRGRARLVNNYDWHRQFTFISFLRDVGRHFRMGAMLGKESVRQRLASDNGMSFTEFCYQTLQGYDFLHLYDAYGCRCANRAGSAPDYRFANYGFRVCLSVPAVQGEGLHPVS